MDLQEILRQAHESMLAALHHVDTRVTSKMHLRVNVMVPINYRLQILAAYNMDNDPDRRMSLGLSAGGAGRCWQTHRPVICDLEEAKQTYQTQYGMTSDEQAQVREDLKSLLCVPIFDQDHYDQNSSSIDDPLLGVLNFDSIEDLLTAFAQESVLNDAAVSARILAEAFKGRL